MHFFVTVTGLRVTEGEKKGIKPVFFFFFFKFLTVTRGKQKVAEGNKK